MYKHILIATDGSELSKRAIDLGVPFAKALNAKVRMG
jgi:nucleotide-binding universal stress UspA family protein